MTQRCIDIDTSNPSARSGDDTVEHHWIVFGVATGMPENIPSIMLYCNDCKIYGYIDEFSKSEWDRANILSSLDPIIKEFIPTSTSKQYEWVDDYKRVHEWVR